MQISKSQFSVVFFLLLEATVAGASFDAFNEESHLFCTNQDGPEMLSVFRGTPGTGSECDEHFCFKYKDGLNDNSRTRLHAIGSCSKSDDEIFCESKKKLFGKSVAVVVDTSTQYRERVIRESGYASTKDGYRAQVIAKGFSGGEKTLDMFCYVYSGYFTKARSY